MRIHAAVVSHTPTSFGTWQFRHAAGQICSTYKRICYNSKQIKNKQPAQTDFWKQRLWTSELVSTCHHPITPNRWWKEKVDTAVAVGIVSKSWSGSYLIQYGDLNCSSFVEDSRFFVSDGITSNTFEEEQNYTIQKATAWEVIGKDDSDLWDTSIISYWSLIIFNVYKWFSTIITGIRLPSLCSWF